MQRAGLGAFSGPRGGTAFVEATGCGTAQDGQAVKRLAAHGRGELVSRGSLAAVLAGPGRVRQGQLLEEVQDAAGQDGDQAGHAGHYLARWSQDDLGSAAAYRLDDLPGGTLGVHGD